MTGSFDESFIYPDNEDARVVEGVADGTMQVQGFRDGDTITIIGVTNNDGVLEPDEIYGGTREELVREGQKPLRSWRTIGVALLVVALVSGFLMGSRRKAFEEA